MSSRICIAWTLALALTANQFSPLPISNSAWAQEIPTSHAFSKKCVSEAGILLCTECRLKTGLAPIVTPGNSDWQPNSSPQKSEHSFVYTTVTIPDDDDDNSDDKKKKHSKQKPDRKKKKHNKSEASPPQQPSIHLPYVAQPVMPIPPNPQPNTPPPPQIPPQLSLPASHLETIELLQNINRTLKSIESMLRQQQENEMRRQQERQQEPMRPQPRPNPNFSQPWNPAPQWNQPPRWSPSPQFHAPQPNSPHIPNAPHMNEPSPVPPPQYQDRPDNRNDDPSNRRPRINGQGNNLPPANV